MTIVWTCLMIATLIFIHELGHYVCARLTQTPMMKFSLGFGKLLCSCSLQKTPAHLTTEPSYLLCFRGWNKKEFSRIVFAGGFLKRSFLKGLFFSMGSISWEIRLLPLGGFVDPDLSRDKPRLFRDSLVIIGGPMANFLFALGLLTICRMQNRDLDFVNAFVSSGESIWDMAVQTFQFILHPFDKSQTNQLMGPIGIFSIGKEYLSSGWNHIGIFVASLSCALGLMNALIIPPLDGGRLLFIWIRAFAPLQGKRLEHAVASIGTISLFFLMILVAIQDVSRLF
ncbi:MAG: site-2 protease family protein [Patescibacteria group bacterium]